MLYAIAVVLLIAWLLGFVGVYTVGAFIHVLLVVALVLFVVGLLSGRARSYSGYRIDLRAPTAIRTGPVSNLADE